MVVTGNWYYHSKQWLDIKYILEKVDISSCYWGWVVSVIIITMIDVWGGPGSRADQDDGTELLQCFQFQGVPARQQQIRIFGKFVLLILETDHQSQSLSYSVSCLWCLWCLSWNDKEIHNSWQRAQKKKDSRLLLLMECRQWWSLYSLTLPYTGSNLITESSLLQAALFFL